MNPTSIHQIEERVTCIFRANFNDPALVLHDQMSAKDVPGWDSFSHINLIVQLEEEFGIQFTDYEVGSLMNVGELLALIRKKLGL